MCINNAYSLNILSAGIFILNSNYLISYIYIYIYIYNLIHLGTKIRFLNKYNRYDQI